MCSQVRIYLALDNKEAKIEIAQEVPVASTISQPQTTTELTTSQIQFKSVGIILTVTPQINEKKQVTLKINQEVSQIGSTVPDRRTGLHGLYNKKGQYHCNCSGRAYPCDRRYYTGEN